MHPDAILSNANSYMAMDWHATSGHAFPINGGTIPQLSMRQEDAPSPTTQSDHVAMTHGSKEASHPHCPIPDTFGGSKTLTTHDHHYHPPDHTHRHAAQPDPTGP